MPVISDKNQKAYFDSVHKEYERLKEAYSKPETEVALNQAIAAWDQFLSELNNQLKTQEESGKVQYCEKLKEMYRQGSKQRCVCETLRLKIEYHKLSEHSKTIDMFADKLKDFSSHKKAI